MRQEIDQFDTYLLSKSESAIIAMSQKRKASATEDHEHKVDRKRKPELTGRKEGIANLLTEELLLQVFSWLPLENIHKCMLVCRKWNRVANDNKVCLKRILKITLFFFFFFSYTI